ncbi:hypothetical protein AWC21_01590 [Mycolicibacterium peregrinum]|nr:hypothetical protein AWC21_01590 [Mycolicibacterium peregrinum]
MNPTSLDPVDQLTNDLFTSMLALGLPPDKRDAIELIRQDLSVAQARLGRRASTNPELQHQHAIAVRNAVANARAVLSSL